MAGLWMIKDIQSIPPYSGNPVLNVYGYRSNIAVLNEAVELLNAFVAQLLPLIIAVQTATTYHATLESYELNGTGFSTRTLTTANQGTRNNDYETKFVAWGFKLLRANLGDRSGAKRIGLVADMDVSLGAPVAGMNTALSALAVGMGIPLKVGLIDTWFPVILERPTPPSTVWADHPSNGAVFTGVTSQNTRKR
jgi:hypothetical protein